MLVKVVRFILPYATFRGNHFSKNPVFSVIFSQKSVHKIFYHKNVTIRKNAAFRSILPIHFNL